MPKILLCTPGPTPIPDQVQGEMSLPMIHHRSKEFQDIFGQVRTKISTMLECDGETILLASSGSGGMEASVASLFSKGDHVVIVESGKFGQRWVELAKRYELDASVIQVPWGKAVTPEQISQVLRHDSRGVLMQASETSTGVFHPVEAIGKILKDHPSCMYILDGITAVGIHPIHMKSMGVDVVIGGSQKALMCPPGVATISLSLAAMDRVQPSQTMYLSIEKELKTQIKNVSAFTPAISIVRGLNVALDLMFEEGLDQVYQRHARLAQKTREVFTKAGLPLLNSSQDASNGITVVGPDLDWDVGAWIQSLKDEHGLWIAGGQEHLKGKIFRFAHMGWAHEESVNQALQILLTSLKKHIDMPPLEDIF